MSWPEGWRQTSCLSSNSGSQATAAGGPCAAAAHSDLRLPRPAWAALPSKRSDGVARTFNPQCRPYDWQIKSGLAVGGDPIAATFNRAEQANGIEHPIAQRVAADTLLGFVRFRIEADCPQQALKERQSGEEAKIRPGGGP